MRLRRVACAPGAARGFHRVVAVVLLGLAVSACGAAIDPTVSVALSDRPTPRGATVAFESIDGPPPAVFARLVSMLNEEAMAQRLAVASRNGSATYRVRGYVSAVVSRGQTSFVWVWDIYDGDKQRALRVTGEELAGSGHRRNAWAAADDRVIRRIVHNGIERIAGFLNEPPRSTAVAAAPSFLAASGLRAFALQGGAATPAASLAARSP
jgi:hypothetical protein